MTEPCHDVCSFPNVPSPWDRGRLDHGCAKHVDVPFRSFGSDAPAEHRAVPPRACEGAHLGMCILNPRRNAKRGEEDDRAPVVASVVARARRPSA